LSVNLEEWSMLQRNGLLGLTGLVAVAGLAVAAPAPPINPQVEGREPNPVIREFHETEKPATETGAGLAFTGQSKRDEHVTQDAQTVPSADVKTILLEMLSRLYIPG
jgi:hypothetical protein